MPTAFGFEITPDGQGAVFALNAPAKRNRRQTIGSWEVEIRKDNSYICVRSPVSDLSKSLSKIVEEPADIAAQEFLDILAVEERTPLLVAEPRDNLLWRSGPHGLKFQLTTSITFSAQVGELELTVTDAKGNVVPPPTYEN